MRKQMIWIFKNLHWLIAILGGIVWTFVYFFFGILHGDWEMYIERFPFLFASFFFQEHVTTTVAGWLSAVLDAVVLGFVFGFIVRIILKRV